MNHIVDENVLKRIRGLDFVSDVIISNSELSVVVEDAETGLPVVMEVLRNEGISVKKISTDRPNLDDVFLKYTGTVSSISGVSEIRQDRSIGRKR
jgi:ABC-2 type transport system ATP-binding protein